MEEMNGKCVASDPRPLKVLIAHAKDQVTILFFKQSHLKLLKVD
jgi:hypothetical protein